MIAYYFPPLSGSGVFRSIKFVKYLPSFNWLPTVISTDTAPVYWNYYDESQVAEIPKEVEIFRVHDKFNEEIQKGYSLERVNEVLNFSFNAIRNNEQAANIFVQLSKSQEGLVQLLRIPCMALTWACDTFKYIEENIDMSKFDLLYTTSGPYSSHLIGYYLSQKYNIPWVADWRDQWTDNHNEGHDVVNNPVDKLSVAFEKNLLHQASCNVTTADDAVQMYIDHFNLPKTKVAFIPNGYDEEDFKDYPMVNNKTEKFTLNYSGLIYTKEQSVEPIFRALKQLCSENLMDKNHIQFVISGKSFIDVDELARKYDLESTVVQTGYVSHEKAVQGNVNSDLLILLVGDSDILKRVYTGKIFDYLRSGRPILALAPKNGVVDRILKESGHGNAFLSTQTKKIKKMILDEYLKWKNNENLKRLYSPKIKKFERKFLTSHLVDIFNRVKS